MYYIEGRYHHLYYSKELIDRNLWLGLLQLRHFNIFFSNLVYMQVQFNHIYMNLTYFFFNNFFFFLQLRIQNHNFVGLHIEIAVYYIFLTDWGKVNR